MVTAADISETLWEVTQEYGVRIGVDEQVMVARRLAIVPRRLPNDRDVRAAFERYGLARPSQTFCNAVANRLRRLYGPALAATSTEQRESPE